MAHDPLGRRPEKAGTVGRMHSNMHEYKRSLADDSLAIISLANMRPLHGFSMANTRPRPQHTSRITQSVMQLVSRVTLPTT